MAINHKKTGWVILALCLLISLFLTLNYIRMWKDDVIIPGPGVTKTKWLSDYAPELRGTLAIPGSSLWKAKNPAGPCSSSAEPMRTNRPHAPRP